MSAYYVTHRPKTFKAVEGNLSAIESLQQMLKGEFPQVVLFHGPSGTGKTTLARIVSGKLGVEVGSVDYVEINASNNRGIEFFREQISSMRIKPFLGGKKVYVIDECHRLTKESMDCLLKPCEDTPSHCYIFLCTTDPGKLLKAILTRCVKVECLPLDEEQIIAVLKRIAKLTKTEVPHKVLELIASTSEGSSREAINKLQSLIGLPEDRMVEVAEQQLSTSTEVIDLCRLMMSKDSKNWKKIAAIIKDLDQDAEGVRRQILGYANSCLLGGSMKAYCILDAFRQPLYDIGKPGITLGCFEAIHMDDPV